jgi:phosphonate degradation associated HDIG domain protein
MSVVDTILGLFARGGSAAYFGEAVSQQEHALQCAHLAERSGAADELVAAALLHDIGHLLHQLAEDCAEHGIDDRHEAGGALWLERHFPAAVTAPIRLHVAAKRYLCAIAPEYRASLSPASQRSLDLQGGAFSAAEVQAFERLPQHQDAIVLRRWDDEAKVPGLAVPVLATYRCLLERVVIRL